MPGRSPGEEDNILSQLQLHRVQELHRLVEQRRIRSEQIEGGRDRERERESDRITFRTALRRLSGAAASRYESVFADSLASDDELGAGAQLQAGEGHQRTALTWRLEAEDLRAVEPCSFLRPGQVQQGRQKVNRPLRLPSNPEEQWRVEVHFQEVDLQRGYLSGCMRAENVPNAQGPVTTFWEGEIVDNKNFSFVTSRWDAVPASDFKHWAKFPAFEAIQSEVKVRRGRCSRLSNFRYIFMRWKEHFFVDATEDCGLTIQGFYYICMSRETGAVTGYYFDPTCAPSQKLELEPKRTGSGGITFSCRDIHT